MFRNHATALAAAALSLVWGGASVAEAGGSKDLAALNAEIAETSALMDACPGSLIKMVPCFERFSQRGNGAASKALAELYADPASGGEPSGLKASPGKSIDYIVLAIQQGSFTALKFIPPKPYKLRIGMSGKQVMQSVDGPPKKVVRTETANAYGEDWIYPSGVLHFERSPISDSNVVLKEITTVTTP